MSNPADQVWKKAGLGRDVAQRGDAAGDFGDGGADFLEGDVQPHQRHAVPGAQRFEVDAASPVEHACADDDRVDRTSRYECFKRSEAAQNRIPVDADPSLIGVVVDEAENPITFAGLAKLADGDRSAVA